VEEQSLANDAIRRTLELWKDGWLKHSLEMYHGEKAHDVFSLWANTGMSSWFRNWSIEKHLPNVTCPALIIQGKNDIFITEEHAQTIAAGLGGPTEVVLLPECGHAPHLEFSGAVLKLMRDFIAGLIRS